MELVKVKKTNIFWRKNYSPAIGQLHLKFRTFAEVRVQHKMRIKRSRNVKYLFYRNKASFLCFKIYSVRVNTSVDHNIWEKQTKNQRWEENHRRKTNYFIRCIVLGKIFYCIRKYFIMWNVQSRSITQRLKKKIWKVGVTGRKNK